MNEKRKVLIIGVLVLMVIALGGILAYYWYNNTYFVSTEDARVTGDLVKVTPQISGKLLEFDVEEGDTVIKDQILGRLEAVGVADTSIDTSLVRSPIDGLVVKKQANIGEVLMSTSAPTLAMIVDPKKLYISANIEETKLGRVRTGQKVDITVDQLGGVKLTGKVKFVGEAANSAFSLLPASTSGTFTKVVQRVPVKIEIENKENYNLLPGTNAVIKIHVK